MNHTIPITKARKNIFTLINDVNMKGTRYLLTDKGYAKAIIMSVEEFEAWQETLDVMKDFPDLDKTIEQTHAEYKKGKYITIEELLRHEGYILAENTKGKYEISRHNIKARRKKI